MRILVTNDDGIHAPGLEACEEIARALSDDVWVVAPETDQSGVSHSLSLNDPLRLREVGERHFAVQGHADRLRHHGRAPHHEGGAGPRAVRRQSRPQRRRGRDLFRHGRRRDGRHRARHSVVRAVAGLRLRQPSTSRIGRPRSSTRPTSSAACSRPACRATCWSTSIFPIARRTRSQGIAVAAQGKRDQELLRIDARHDGRGNPYYWIAFGARRHRRRRGRQRSCGARRQAHRGDAAAARPHRRAVHDASLRRCLLD